MRNGFVMSIWALMITGILFLSSSCKEDDQTPLEQLPPITQEGLNTFGCLVNGKPWIPEGNTGTSNLDISYDPTWDGGLFDLAAYRVLREEDRQYIYLYSINVNGQGSFELNNVNEGAATFINYKVCTYDRDASVYRDGTLTITRFDLENKIISGTFEFILAKPGCDTLRFTEGRFDVEI